MVADARAGFDRWGQNLFKLAPVLGAALAKARDDGAPPLPPERSKPGTSTTVGSAIAQGLR